MKFRRCPGDIVWHNNADCWNWPGGSYEGRTEFPPGGVICFECSERRRAALDYVPPLPAARELPGAAIGSRVAGSAG